MMFETDNKSQMVLLLFIIIVHQQSSITICIWVIIICQLCQDGLKTITIDL